METEVGGEEGTWWSRRLGFWVGIVTRLGMVWLTEDRNADWGP